MIDDQFDAIGKCVYCGHRILYRDIICPKCLKPNDSWLVPTKEQCGNCHERLREDDKYCRYCGTKRGEGAFEPYQNIMECIYGPMPVYRKHNCNKCGYSWETLCMVDNEDFCPQCGGWAAYEGKYVLKT